ncbi:MAG: GNAT family N-acetyltransferase [Rhodospirillaceae bacterium]|nr:GNAT family N-acetyltransferase [Rhodospirillaceae bacterium]
MSPIAFLSGTKVTLRPLERRDIDGAYPSWLNDQNSDRYTEHAIFPRNIDDILRYYEGLRTDRSILHLAIIARENGHHVGNVSLQSIDWVSRHAEFAILIGEEEARGKGFGTEAIHLTLDHGFNRLNLNRIWLGVNAENTTALTLYHRAGFKKEGLMRQHIIREGRAFDMIIMGLLASDFYALRGERVEA